MMATLSIRLIASDRRERGNPAFHSQHTTPSATQGWIATGVNALAMTLTESLARNAILAALVCLCALGMATPAAAQTVPTYGESSVGRVNCGRLEHGTDFDTLFQCNTSAANGGTIQKAPLFVGNVTSPPYAATTCDANKAGMIQWTGSAFQGCDGISWNSLGFAACAGPSAFSFTNQTNVQTSTTITSNTQTLTGFACTASAVCTNCLILKNGAVQGTTANFVTGDQIAIQLTSSANFGTAVTANVYVGQTNSGTWSVTTTSDTCGGTPAAGAICSDGTVYAGLSPDGNVKMYTTRCDVGQAWDGSTCTGTRTTKKWSYSNTILTGVTNAVSGRTNTNNLYALNGTNADSPYEAATFCQDLVINGQSDWYLPSSGEINVLYTSKAAIANFDISGTYYWSSTEYGNSNAWLQRFSDGSQSNTSKYYNYLVRCVRR